MIRRPPRSPLFPYPPLSRSLQERFAGRQGAALRPAAHAGIGREPRVDLLRFQRDRLQGCNEEDALVKAAEADRSEEHTSELQSQSNLVCRLLLEKKNKRTRR